MIQNKVKAHLKNLLSFTAEHRRDVSAKYFSIYYDEDYREYDVDVEL